MPGMQPRGPSRIDVAQQSIQEFIEKRNGDRLALFVFDGTARLYCPLTANHIMLKKQVQEINKKAGGSTNFDGPSNSFRGQLGPIQGAIDHLRDYGQAKTKIFIIVTDGVSSIEPERFEALATAMEKMKIKIYAIGVGSDWSNGSTTDLERFVGRLKGKVIKAGDADAMRRAIASIDEMEKSEIVTEHPTTHRDVYEWFALLAAAGVLLYIGSSALLNQNP